MVTTARPAENMASPDKMNRTTTMADSGVIRDGFHYKIYVIEPHRMNISN